MGTPYTRCANKECNAPIWTEEDGHICGRVKCFNEICDDCRSGYRYELDVCGEECADDAARELTAKVRELHIAARVTREQHAAALAAALAANTPAAGAADRIIEYVDNRWLGIPDGPVTVRTARKVAA